MFKICWTLLRENLRGVGVATAIALFLIGAIAATEISRPAPVAHMVRMEGTVEGIQRLDGRGYGITYHIRLEDNRLVLVSDRRDRRRHWVGSTTLIEEATYQDGSISYRFVNE